MKMKKIVLSLAGVMAATAFAPEASAVPAFARQQGKACATCHFQHYPALNDYGRSFKAGGFTDMGKQGLIKGEGMSLPEVANSSLFFKFRYQDTNGTDNTATGDSGTASGQWQIPDEFALLMGGRVSENAGYMFEGQLADGTAPVLAGFKMPIMFPVGEGEMKVGVVPFATDALGSAYGFELLNTGAVRNIRVSEHRSETSAQQYLGTALGAQGLAFVVVDPMFFVNVTRYADGEAKDQKMNLNYIRAAVTPTVGEWDVGAGIQMWSGTKSESNGVTGDEIKGTALDAQAQGAVAGMPLGVYFTYATAPASSATVSNVLNTGTANAKKAMVFTAELGVLPGTATVLASYRKADTGAATNSKDDAITIGATYQLAQNIQLQFMHSTRSKNGTAGRYDSNSVAAPYNANGTGPAVRGDQLTTFMLSAGL